ncbi:MAG TPA: transketolase C-terminal domain-containing protein [Verrucomicrobiae bacterium]|nr:transketolase C-terminal domain-containing protein [Verrucomicrobiae bacterium]
MSNQTETNVVPIIADLSKAEMVPTRNGFGEGLLEEGGKNKDVVALCADLTESIRMEAFSKAYPAQFVEVGVAEQNMMGIAAGLALSGKIPFVASYAVFNPGRNWDQLRVSVAYSQANVKVVGAHAGISVGPDGATHQALEDVAITRVLPDLTVVVPTDAVEAKKAVAAIVAHKGPVYIRFGRDKVPTVTLPETPFVLGKANVVREGTDVTICANGPLVYEALVAAEELAKSKIQAEVIVVHTVKPLDGKTIVASLEKTGAVVTAEEAQITGGLGGAIAELAGEKCPVPLRRIGVEDRFGESGSPTELMDKYGLRAANIVDAVKAVIKMKK